MPSRKINILVGMVDPSPHTLPTLNINIFKYRFTTWMGKGRFADRCPSRGVASQHLSAVGITAELLSQEPVAGPLPGPAARSARMREDVCVSAEWAPPGRRSGAYLRWADRLLHFNSIALLGSGRGPCSGLHSDPRTRCRSQGLPLSRQCASAGLELAIALEPVWPAPRRVPTHLISVCSLFPGGFPSPPPGAGPCSAWEGP